MSTCFSFLVLLKLNYDGFEHSFLLHFDKQVLSSSKLRDRLETVKVNIYLILAKRVFI